jgi:hypothetical protein
VEVCDALGGVHEKLFVWQVDKRFCVLTKMIDYLLEPIAHSAGHDFYKNSYASKFANYIYFGLYHMGSPAIVYL